MRSQCCVAFGGTGSLVPNAKGAHPYQADVPAEYADRARWFLLDTSLTPQGLRPEEFDNAHPPSQQTEVPVFALALVSGAAPEREWLVFAHAPREARRDVQIQLPDFGPIRVDVPQSGSFFHVSEKDRSTRVIVAGGPASLHIDAPQMIAAGEPASLSVSELYNPRGSIDSVEWDLGDGAHEKRDQITHRYSKPGQYFISVVGRQDGTEVVRRQTPLFVGIGPQAGQVCRLLMKGALAEGMASWIWLSDWDKVEYHFIPDASGKGNIGFLAGGKWVQDEARGMVLELNGSSDRVEIGNSPDINAAAECPQRTMALWFRAKSVDPVDSKSPGPSATCFTRREAQAAASTWFWNKKS